MSSSSAVAGPSSPSSTIKQEIQIFPPPHLPSGLRSASSSVANGAGDRPEKTRPPLRTTEDLLSRFGLLDDYDRFVTRGYGTEDSGLSAAELAKDADMEGGSKVDTPVAQQPQTPLAGGPPQTPQTAAPPQPSTTAEEDGAPKKRDKLLSSYRLLIRQIPGKHSYKKDDYLKETIENPNVPFGLNNEEFYGPPPPLLPHTHMPQTLSQRRGDGSIPLLPPPILEGFNVSAEGLKGWNPSALVAESKQAREDRKRRKELKKLARAQQLQQQATIAAAHSAPATTSSTPRPSVQSATPRPGGTPRGGTPRPATAAAHPAIKPTPGSNVPTGTPRPSQQAPGMLGSKRPLERDAPTPQSTQGGDGGKPMPRPFKKARVEGVGT